MKKTFYTIATALLMSTGAFAQTQVQAQNISSRIESKLPSDLPNLFNGVKICLDPGHGGHNGANDRHIYWMDKYINKYSTADEYGLTYWESNGNFYTALYMREVLQELGAQVKLTREKNDNDIVNGSYGNGGPIGSSDPTLSNREAVSNAYGAKYFQSIHTNAAGDVPGAALPNEVDYVRVYTPNPNSSTQTAVASKMASYHASINYTHDTKAQVHSFGVTNNVNAYAVLTEGGFHTQMAEARRLRSTLYLQANAMAWIKAFVAQEGKESLITWGEIGGIAYSEEATEYDFGNPKDGRGLEFGLGMNEVKVILDKGTDKERSIIVDENELDANYNEGEYVSGGNHVTKNGGYNGYYYFNFVSPGSHTLTFQKAGVATKTQTVNVLRGKHFKNDVLLKVSNDPVAPVANNDVVEVNVDIATVIDVLANDFDDNGDVDVKTIAIVTNPSKGNVIVENGKVTYTPNEGYLGSDSFAYTVKDGQPKVSNTASVSIEVKELPCVLTATSTDTYFVRYVLFRNVDNVKLIENITIDNGGYLDAKSNVIDFVAGNEYRTMLRGKYGIDNNVNKSYWKVYVDYNDNGEFNDEGETLVSKENDAYAFQNFTISNKAINGSHVLRVVTSSNPITCGEFTGEIEDYTVNITGGACRLTATSNATNHITSLRVYEIVKDADGDDVVNVFLDNTKEGNTGNNGGYIDNKDVQINLIAGNTYLSNINLPYKVVPQRINKIWIDIDGDGAFDGENEEVGSKMVAAATGWNPTTFTLPETLEGGEYTIRFAMSVTNDTDLASCGVITLGEFEDYTVSVTQQNLAIAEVETVKVLTYPNPVVNTLNVELSNDVKSLEVYSISGMLVYSANNLNDKTAIDASAWKAGIYLVVVNTENERKVSKIIKK